MLDHSAVDNVLVRGLGGFGRRVGLAGGRGLGDERLENGLLGGL